ncbi:MAG TPA: aminoglycoside phosphotransferase family protein [Longimicrobium sp.]
MQHAVAGPGCLLARSHRTEVYVWSERAVLKLPCPGWEHQVALEEENTRAVQGTPLPVRRVVGRVRVDGREGLLLERLDGPTVLQLLARRPLMLPRVARLLAQVHAEVHAQVVPALRPLRGELREYLHAAPLPGALRQTLLRYLERLAWDECVCHGDFHPGNLFLTGRGVRVIDWLDAVHGPPLYDVATTVLTLRTGLAPDTRVPRWLVRAAQAALCGAYLRRYFALRPAGREHFALWQVLAGARMLAEDAPVDRARLTAAIRRAADEAARQGTGVRRSDGI